MTPDTDQIPDESSLEFLLEYRKLSEQEKYKNLLLALVLTHFGETFEYFNANELAGSFIFDSTCDELFESMRQQKEDLLSQSSDEDNLKDEESNEKINKTIFILLMSIYAEVAYVLEEVLWVDFSPAFSADINLLLDYSLFRDENQSVCEKVIKLSSLLNESLPTTKRDFLLQLAHSKLQPAMDFWGTGIVTITVCTSLQDINDQKITKAEFSDLYEKNLKSVKEEEALYQPQREAKLAAEAKWTAEAAERAAKAAERAEKKSSLTRYFETAKINVLTDKQWVVIEPLITEPKPRDDKRSRLRVENRGVLDAILWILRTGANWRKLPNQFPHYQTCYNRFRIWVNDGTLKSILETLGKNSRTSGESNLHEFLVNGIFVSPKMWQRNWKTHRSN